MYKYYNIITKTSLEYVIICYNKVGYTNENYKECDKAAKEAIAGHNNIGDRIGFLTPDYLERLFGGKYRDKLVIGNVAFFNV